jgi:hypothetical protein
MQLLNRKHYTKLVPLVFYLQKDESHTFLPANNSIPIKPYNKRTIIFLNDPIPKAILFSQGIWREIFVKEKITIPAVLQH